MLAEVRDWTVEEVSDPLYEGGVSRRFNWQRDCLVEGILGVPFNVRMLGSNVIGIYETCDSTRNANVCEQEGALPLHGREDLAGGGSDKGRPVDVKVSVVIVEEVGIECFVLSILRWA